MALKILLEPLRKGTMEREKRKAEIEAAKANPASKPTKFVCRLCLQSTPITEVGRRYTHGPLECKACWAVSKSKIDGTYRTKRFQTIESVRRSRQKANVKKYKSGKLPGWMFS